MTAPVTEQAANWLHRLQQDPSPECRAQFDRWLREASIHVEEFLLAKALWTELGHLSRSSAAAALAFEVAPEPAVIPLRKQHAPVGADTVAAAVTRPVWSGRQRMALAAGLAALAIGSFVFLGNLISDGVLTTGIGGQESFRLEDGSVVLLNTDSRVEVRFDKRRRTLRLIRGEALFTAARDPDRPLTVETDNASVRALGTQFNVRRTSASETRIAVVDGVVQVSAPEKQTDGAIRLTAGNEATVVKTTVVKTEAPDVPRTMSWRARRLVFPESRLEDIAAEFNRYNTLRIRVEGENVRNRLISGMFDADDPTPLLRYLDGFADVEVISSNDEVLIRERRR